SSRDVQRRRTDRSSISAINLVNDLVIFTPCGMPGNKRLVIKFIKWDERAGSLESAYDTSYLVAGSTADQFVQPPLPVSTIKSVHSSHENFDKRTREWSQKILFG